MKKLIILLLFVSPFGLIAQTINQPDKIILKTGNEIWCYFKEINDTAIIYETLEVNGYRVRYISIDAVQEYRLDEYRIIKLARLRPGDYLRRGGNQVLVSYYLGSFGSLVYSVGIIKNKDWVKIAGGTMLGVGTYLQFRGVRNIKRAGKAMNLNDKSGIIVTPDGIGIRYNL